MITTLTIGGVTKVPQLGWVVNRTANGRSTFTFNMYSADASYRPALDAQVVLINNSGGAILFGGNITNPREASPLNQPTTPIMTSVTAAQYSAWAERRYVFESIPAGTLKAALLQVQPYLTALPLHPSQVDGPTLPPLVYEGVKGIDVLNDLTAQSGGYLWEINDNGVLRMYLPGTVAAPFNIISGPGCLAVGDVVVEPMRKDYANRVIARTSTLTSDVSDAGEIAAHGYWEHLVIAPDETTQIELDALAAVVLATRLPILKQVTYRTRTDGLMPGQTQTITIAQRNLNNTFLITDVNIRGDDGGVVYDVTALEGLMFKSGWRETYRQWAGVTSPAVAVGGGGGVSGNQRFAYFLGGSGIDAVQSPTPTWIPASGGSTTLGQGAIQAQINTVPRGDTSATVKTRLRVLTSGNSVQARLYDVTSGTPCAGTSAVVTATTWQTAVFGVTLTAGSHLYELQLLPGLANEDVFGTGYLE